MNQERILAAPVSGVVIPLENVPDAAFAQKLVGIGGAIDPTQSEILSPFDGKVTQVHSARHALGLIDANGVEMLIHVGLDTVKMKGEGFEVLVKAGQDVRQGQLLLRFDADLVARKAKSLMTEVVFTKTEQIKGLRTTDAAFVKAGAPLLHFQLQDASSSVPSAQSTALPEKQRSMPIQIRTSSGLHARPAAMLAGMAKRYTSEISIHKGERSANLRSLVGVMGLEIARGDQVYLTAEGTDAEAALAALTSVLQQDLDQQSGEALPSTSPVVARAASQGNRLTGLTASPGRALGRVFQLQHPEITVAKKGGTVVQEMAKLEKALKDARAQLEALSQRLRRSSMDAGKAGIFEAHQELLQDPALLELAHNEINQGQSAAYAWKKAYLDLSVQLKSLRNQLLAARANDILDVGVRVLHLLVDVQPTSVEYPERSILIAEDLTPSDVANLDARRILGFCTTSGGPTSHVAILARSLDLPALAGIDPAALQIPNGTTVLLNADAGELSLNPSADEARKYEESRRRHDERRQAERRHALEPAVTKDGRRVEIAANLKGTSEIPNAIEGGAEGVGLLRTEFLFMDRLEAPTEQEQYEAYHAMAQGFGRERPLIIRTLDVGGDKPLRYLPLPAEDNPFLGERGLRVSLNRPEMFRTQLRAILRASTAGNVRIMFPMVTTLHEFRQARAMVEEERARLKVPPVQIGIMVEVPSTALLADQFAVEADFFSVGSNDLAQYTLAIDRGHPKLAAQVDGLDPSLLRLIQYTVIAAHAQGKWVGICGGIAGDLQAVPILVGLGIDELSVSIPAVASVKALVRRLEMKECEVLASKALNCGTATDVRALVPQGD